MPFNTCHQYDSMDCGPACIQMIAKHFGRYIAMQYLREQAEINKEGVSMLGLAQAAEKCGFDTAAVKTSQKVLKNPKNLPAILHWNNNHFVVLYKTKKNKFYLADPKAGLIKLDETDFLNGWVSDNDSQGGFALFMKPTNKFFSDNTTVKTNNSLKNIFSYLTPHKRLVFQLFIGLAIGSAFQFVLPFLAKNVVDTAINTNNLDILLVILVAQLALFMGRMSVDFIRNWILLHISMRINVTILNLFLEKLLRLPVPFFDSKNTGDMLQRINDHRRIEQFLTGSSLSILFSLTSLIIFSITLMLMNAKLFYVFIFASVLYAFWVAYFLGKRKEWDYKNFSLGAKEQGMTIQLIQGMQEIKLHNAGKPFLSRWRKLQTKLFILRRESLSINQKQQAGAFFINETKNIIITFFAAKAVIDGQMSLGTMLAVQYIIGQLNSPIEQMIGFLQSLQNARISMDRLNEIHAMDDEDQSGVTTLSYNLLTRLKGGRNGEYENQQIANYGLPHHEDMIQNLADTHKDEIIFDNVSFTYPGAGNAPVLKNICLSFPIGKTTAIVGMSGSGKTTLLKLLLKFYKPSTGNILMNDQPLENISHTEWRKHCGVVMQESFIFSDTIAANIAIGEECIDIEKLTAAAAVANIDEFIQELPQKYLTLIGPEGIGLSKGQQQRLFIARAVYKDPSMIFFDEATNSLDANNEKGILEKLKVVFRNKTVVVVAHRLSTVRDADQVVVLKNGQIAETGSHQDLINSKGDYYTLVKNQLY